MEEFLITDPNYMFGNTVYSQNYVKGYNIGRIDFLGTGLSNYTVSAGG